MPRPSLTPSQRADAVTRAIIALQTAIQTANTYLSQYGASDPRTVAAWETVEQYGATVHRQSRLLAGKTKGG